MYYFDFDSIVQVLQSILLWVFQQLKTIEIEMPNCVRISITQSILHQNCKLSYNHKVLIFVDNITYLTFVLYFHFYYSSLKNTFCFKVQSVPYGWVRLYQETLQFTPYIWNTLYSTATKIIIRFFNSSFNLLPWNFLGGVGT